MAMFWLTGNLETLDSTLLKQHKARSSSVNSRRGSAWIIRQDGTTSPNPCSIRLQVAREYGQPLKVSFLKGDLRGISKG